MEQLVAQYEVLNNGKGFDIAKQLVLGKIKGQSQVLKKYGLRQHDFAVMEKVSNLEADDLSKLRARSLQSKDFVKPDSSVH